jgi:hypothetical protein
VRGRRRRLTGKVGTQKAAVISERVTGSAARRDGGKTSGGKTRAGVDILRRAIGGSQTLHYASHRPGRSMSVPLRDSKGDSQRAESQSLRGEATDWLPFTAQIGAIDRTGREVRSGSKAFVA